MEFWIRIYNRQFEARKNPYEKPARDGKKIEETLVGTKPKKIHDLPTKPIK